MLKCTVLISTYRRPELLTETLRSLAEQSIQSFDVVVRNDGSGESYRNAYSQVISNSNLNITYLTGENAGIAASANILVEQAGSGLLILTDDDIIADKDFVKRHLEHHRDHPGTVMYGAVKMYPGNIKTDQDRYKEFAEREWQRKTGTSEIKARTVRGESLTITAANLSFTWETFDNIGAFDESLRDAQDYDFGLRALKKGVDVWYDPRAIAYHNESFRITEYAKRQKRYIEFNRKLLLKYGMDDKDLRFRIPTKPGFLKRMVYAVLRNPSIQHFISANQLFMIVPRAVRYRIYGVSIAALSQYE